MFIHQLSHVWVDFRGIRDEFMRQHDLDYFENSRRATFVQQQYAIRNPREFEHYDELCWDNGPGPSTVLVDGIERVFHDYIARGAPYGPDDGTLAPWACGGSRCDPGSRGRVLRRHCELPTRRLERLGAR